MKFRLELSINKSRAEVWSAFDNPENMKTWQPSLLTFEPVSGTLGQPGAVSKLTYKENEREFSLLEKVTVRDEQSRLDGSYENEFADNTISNIFIEEGQDTTLWVMETEYRFKTLLMRMLGPLMKKNFVARTEKDMERFKEMVENQ
jgi:polyketide cyclase/dehydrase/lipid transport protein